MKTVELVSKSGKLSATLFAEGHPKIVLIIASATGVKQGYYQKFAQFIAAHEIAVITFDYFGIGGSLSQPIKSLQNNAADWGRNDLESIIQYAFTQFPDSKIAVLGHSIGGQIIGLAPSSNKLNKIILVAAQSGYWKYWKGIGKVKMWFNWYVLFPVVIQLFGYLNAKKLSGMENLPKKVANQWRNWGKDRDYIMGDSSIEKYYENIEVNLTAYAIEDDEFAPMEAAIWMSDQYKNANRKFIELKPSNFTVQKIGHFGPFKEKFRETIWLQFLEEIKKHQ